MPAGYVGKVLRVDLSQERLWAEELDDDTLNNWIGGAGLGAKILYDEVPPGVAWDDPANRLILSAGPLNGTRCVGSGTFTVTTKGPLTNGATSTQANGYFGAYLRFSGFESVVVQGKARRWLYLYIHDDGAELREASHLRGKDTWETQDAIAQELEVRERAISMACIGPAGENLVKLGAVCSDKGHVAGHNGTGAVMGAKRLKAIVAARGRGRVPVANQARLRQAADRLFADAIDPASAFRPGFTAYEWGTLIPHEMIEESGILPIKNYTTNLFPDREAIKKIAGPYIRENYNPKAAPCWACRMHHCHHFTLTEGHWRGAVTEEPEYEGLAAWAGLTGQTEVADAIFLANEVDRLGLDTNGTGFAVSMTMELYEKGVLSRDDLDGLDLSWGNALATRELLHKIAWRDGFGDVLAEGVKAAAERIGGEALNVGVYTQKGSLPRGHDHRAMWSELMDTTLSSTGTIEVAGFRGNPELGIDPPQNPFDPEEVSSFNARANGRGVFVDSTGICNFTARRVDYLIDCLNAATARNITPQEAMQIGKRIVNLLRAFNLRHGVTVDVEWPSERYMSTPVDGPAAGVSIKPHWEFMRANYFEKMGWDRETGKPLPQTLRALGLEKVINDIWEVEPAR